MALIKEDYPTGCTYIVYTRKIIPDGNLPMHYMSVITGEKIEERTDGKYIFQVENDVNEKDEHETTGFPMVTETQKGDGR